MVQPDLSLLDGRARWRHLANTVERSCAAAMNGSATGNDDADCSLITLSNLVLVPKLQ